VTAAPRANLLCAIAPSPTAKTILIFTSLLHIACVWARVQLQKSFGHRQGSQLNRAVNVSAANAGQQCMHTAMINPFEVRQMHADTSARSAILWSLRYLQCTLQTFQCGKAKPREQPPAPVAVHTQPVSSTVTVSQASASSSPSGDPVSDQRQKLTASPGSQHTGTSLLSGAQASSCTATPSISKSVKRKHGSKVEQLPSLQDAPGVPEKLGDHPLRLIIVGHNPSDHAW